MDAKSLRHALFGALIITSFACDRDSEPPPGAPSAGEAPADSAATSASISSPRAASASAAARSAAAPPPKCPESMARIPGGVTWIGSSKGRGVRDERPRFKTRLPPFCLDRTEVTVEAYERCEQAGDCEPARRGPVLCTASGSKRKKHPINCVTWHQARAYCQWRDARLPSEIEWEHAASGGDDRMYSWGNQQPDGRTCWKKAGACPVGSFEPGAFGLYDMTGNVWEWTSDRYGPYPWPPKEGATRVYRGGSWSRRFVKWMRVRLRNRWQPSRKGAHLGFRCAKDLPDTKCPFGRQADGQGCRRGVLDAECGDKESWNGVRCAGQEAPRCPPGQEVEEGYGCVGARRPTVRSDSKEVEEEVAPVSRVRSPEHDEDCRTHQPSRPFAWRFSGGTHAKRNQAGKKHGCKNRDVGRGWNSACCP